MKDNDFYVSPLVIEITLYRYNWKDAQIISYFRNKSFTFNIVKDSNSFFISKDEIQNMLNTKYYNEVQNLKNLPTESLSQEVNSVYFLDNILTTYKKLQYIKVNVSYKRHFSRNIENMVTFNYKINYVKVNLAYILSEDKMKDIKNLFAEVGLLTPSKITKESYIQINTLDMFDKISSFIESNNEYALSYQDLVECVSEKLESDNSTLLLMIEK